MQYHMTFESPRRHGPRFLVSGLEYDPSTRKLGLAALPGDPLTVGPLYAVSSDAPTEAGVAIDSVGRLYVSDQASQRVWRVNLSPCAAIESVTAWPEGLGAIKAAALLSGRLGILWTAEPDANRVRGFDQATGAPRAELSAALDGPSFLAGDSSGRLYVSDAKGVTRFATDGSPDPLPTPVLLRQAGAIAVMPEIGDEVETLVVADGPSLQRFDLDGNPLPWTNSNSPISPTLAGSAPLVGQVNALIAWQGQLWLGLTGQDTGQPKSSRLYVFDPMTLNMAPVTSAGLDAFHVGGLAVTCPGSKPSCNGLSGRLLIHDPTTASVIAVRPAVSRQSQGKLLAGPFKDVAGLGRWYRLRSPGASPTNARFRFLTITTDPGDKAAPSTVEALVQSNPPPAPEWYLTEIPPLDPTHHPALVGVDSLDGDTASDPPDAPSWTPLDRWREAPDDSLDTRVWHAPAPLQSIAGRFVSPPDLWVAAFFGGDATVSGTATLGPLTVEANHEGWENDLPAIYQRDSLTAALAQGDSLSLPPPTLLDGLLGLFEAAADIDQSKISAIPDWFDPRVTPDLPGLATHLGLVPEGLTNDGLRAALTSFSEVANLRGTAEGLERAVREETGVEVKLFEPIQTASLWVLGKTGALGALTRLAPGPTQGAILDQTATLDEAHLIDADDEGASLWDDLVGRVIARVYESEVPDTNTYRTLLSRLRSRAPAHSDVTVQVIQPRARVGYQATLGVDAVLARDNEGTRPLTLGEPLGPEHPLVDDRPSRSPGTTWLGHETVL